MKKILKGLHKGEAIIAGLFLGIMTIVTFLAAFNRFTIKIAMPWSEELVRYLLLWDSIIAAAYGIPLKAHVGIDVISSRVKPGTARAMKIITSLCALVFLGVMFYFGMKLTINSIPQKSPAMRISMSYVNASLPVGAFLMIIEFIVIILDSIRGTRTEI